METRCKHPFLTKAILLAEFWDGTAAFVVSTLVIVTFGEIMPQSICYKHGLRIGAALVPLLIFFWRLGELKYPV